MRILCVIDSLCAGGAQRQMVELAMGFKEKGHHVFFLTYHPILFFQQNLDQAGIITTCIHEDNYLIRLFKMRRFIRKGNYDAVLSFLESPNIICEISGFPFRKWKLVVGERSASPLILQSFKHRMMRLLHVFANTVVANSQTNIKLVQKANPFLRNRKLKVIYNTLDFERNKPLNTYQPRKDGITNIVIAGRIAYPKNLIGLVEALQLLDIENRKLIKIHWYGERELQSSKADRIDEAMDKIIKYKLDEVIQFYPTNPTIEEKIRNADAVGLFSIYEGFPNSVCEAMACAKPVICTAVSDLPQWLDVPSLLCDPDKPDSIKDALVKLIHLSNEELLQIGNRNYNTAVTYFNRERIVSEYIKILTSSPS